MQTKNNKQISTKISYKGITDINILKENIKKNKPDIFDVVKKTQNIVLQIAIDNSQIKIDKIKEKLEEINKIKLQLLKKKPKNYLDTVEDLNERLSIGNQKKNILEDSDFNEYKVLSEFLNKDDIITKNNFSFIEKNLKKLENFILPIQDVEDKDIHDMVFAVILNLSKLTKYASQDLNLAQKKALLLKENLSDYSFFAIKRGIDSYVLKNTDYPQSLKTLRDLMDLENEEGLILYVNIQFLIS